MSRTFSRSNVQPFSRRILARRIREEADEVAFLRPHPDHPNNAEENSYRTINPASPRFNQLNFVGNFTKGLRHFLAGPNIGEVIPQAYRTLLRALDSANPDDFERIVIGLPRRLVNPQAGLAFDLEGPDSHALFIRPAPRIDGFEAASEMAEVYWMALCRDINFDNFGADPMIAAAVADLSTNYTNYTGPVPVNPNTIFRGSIQGDLVGPFISQFLLRGDNNPPFSGVNDGFIRYGSIRIDQRQGTVMPGIDYLTNFSPDWLNVQNGSDPTGGNFPCATVPDPNRRFIINMRDLANYVHNDDLPQQFINACLILLHLNVPCSPTPHGPVDIGNPYIGSRTQDGFATFGDQHILTLVAEVTTRALKAAWFQKWFVHRRLRPEEFGGLIHKHLSGLVNYPQINPEILRIAPGTILDRIQGRFGSFLLPQAYPEGSPIHPSYPSGHAIVAGACVTILKAYFDESFIIPNPVMVDSNPPPPTIPGTTLVNFVGPPLTVGGELNKLASNVSLGRNMAGIHYRSDYTEGIKLGEEVAIGLLEEQKLTYNENFSFTLTRFDGTAITI